MMYGKREPRQGVLAFEPPLRVRLPEAVRQEAVATLASLMAAMLGDAGRSELDGGSDEQGRGAHHGASRERRLCLCPAVQVQTHVERQRLQYALSDHARELGFGMVEAIDEDLGLSGAGVHRLGFDALLKAVCKGRVGLVLSIEASRPSRNCRKSHTLLDFCAIISCLVGDRERPYDPALIDDRIYLGLLCGAPHKSPAAKRSWQSFSKTCKRISTLPATPSALGR